MNQHLATAGATECRKCTRLLDEGSHFCACGAPTTLATFKERAEFELRQWRAYQAKLAAERTA